MKPYFVMLGLIPGLFLIMVACGAQATSTPVSVQEPTFTPAPTAPPAPTAAMAPTTTLVPTATKVPTATPAPYFIVSPTPTVIVSETATPPPTATTIPPTAEPTGASSITIGANKDNTLYEHPEGALSNGGGQHIFAGYTNGGLARRSVIAFDIAGNIPAGSTIEDVTLTLNLSRTQSASQGIQLHLLLADWGEGVSDPDTNEGGGIAPQTGDATWIHTRFDTTVWQTPGGDFTAEASASEPVSTIGQYTWGSTDQMVADVQAWLDDASSNFGWLLMGNETENQTTKRFDSKENPEEANRPSLTIEYSSQGASQSADTNYLGY